MSRNELNQNAAQVVAAIGCGDAYDGLVVYCICEGQLCNRDTIAIQLQKDAKYISTHKQSNIANRISSPLEPDISAIEPIIQPSSSRRVIAASTSAETTTSSRQLQRPIEQTIAAVIITAAPERKAEERFAAERQQRWRDADDDNFNAASTYNLTAALIAFLASIRLLTLC
uniref:Activin_recp domain-containing protein n=1 Tax=Ascaris lumbricoides TaxID=6252 RepID=A0A0M3IAP2_ASCLU